MKEYRCRRCGDRVRWNGEWDLNTCDQPLTEETRPGVRLKFRKEGNEIRGTATLADGSKIEICAGSLEEVPCAT